MIKALYGGLGREIGLLSFQVSHINKILKTVFQLLVSIPCENHLLAFVISFTGHKDSVSSLAFSYDGQLLACGGLDGVVQICDASSGNLKCVLDGPGLGIEVKPLLIL